MGQNTPTPAEDARLNALAAQLAAELSIRETLIYEAASIEDVDFWRRAARIAGRRLKVPVRTGVARDGSKVWATQERHLRTGH